MADEHATLTITLTDEMSDGIRAITQQLQNLKRATQEVQEQSEKANKEQKRGAQETKQEVDKVLESLGKWGQLARPLREFGEAFRLLPEPIIRTGRAIAEMTTATGHLFTAMNLMGRGIPGGTLGITANGTAVVQVGLHFARASQQMRYQQDALGEATTSGDRPHARPIGSAVSRARRIEEQ